MHVLESYQAKSGRFVPVWTLEIQTPIEDVDKKHKPTLWLN